MKDVGLSKRKPVMNESLTGNEIQPAQQRHLASNPKTCTVC